MSKLIGVILMVFALTFGMTLAGCADKEEPTPADVGEKAEEEKKEGEGSAEKVIEKGEEVKKEADEASPKK